MRLHGPNLVSCKIVTGNQKTLLIGSYLAPSTLDHIPDLEEALNRFWGRDPIVMEYLNTYIGGLKNPWDQQVTDFLVSFGLGDLLDHFQQRLR